MTARTIAVSELRSADILVTTGRAFVSGVIRQGTGTDFSHTVLYAGEGNVIEAIDQGVVERALEQALNEATLVIALRRRDMSDARRRLVIDHARSFVGRPYDYTGAAGAGLSHRRGLLACSMSPGPCVALYVAAKRNASDAHKDTRFFCSELAARAFQLAGMPIADADPSFMTPRAIRVAASLLYVGHLVGGP